MLEKFIEIIPPRFRIFDRPVADFSTTEWKLQRYRPINTDLTLDVQFRIQETNVWTDMSGAALHIRFKVRKAADGSAYANTVPIAFVNNAGAFMWNELVYKMGTQQVCYITDQCGGVGTCSNMHALLRWSDSYAASVGTMSGWYRDTGTGKASVTANTGFAARQALTVGDQFVDLWVPLSQLAGFFRDVRKATIGIEHDLNLRLGNLNNIVMKAAAVTDAPAVTLTTVELWVPQAVPSAELGAHLLDGIRAKKPIELFYGNEEVSRRAVTSKEDTLMLTVKGGRPRFIILAFQKHKKKNNSNKTLAIYDDIRLCSLSLQAKGKAYPFIKYETSYVEASKNYARCYADIVRLFGKDHDYDSGLQINNVDYKNLFPMYVFHIFGEKDMFVSPGEIIVDYNIGVSDAVLAGGIDLISVVVSDKYVSFTPTGDGMRLAVL